MQPEAMSPLGMEGQREEIQTLDRARSRTGCQGKWQRGVWRQWGVWGNQELSPPPFHLLTEPRGGVQGLEDVGIEQG